MARPHCSRQHTKFRKAHTTANGLYTSVKHVATLAAFACEICGGAYDVVLSNLRLIKMPCQPLTCAMRPRNYRQRNPAILTSWSQCVLVLLLRCCFSRLSATTIAVGVLSTISAQTCAAPIILQGRQKPTATAFAQPCLPNAGPLAFLSIALSYQGLLRRLLQRHYQPP